MRRISVSQSLANNYAEPEFLTPPAEAPAQPDATIEQRDYQTRQIEALRASFATGHRSPLAVLPTGGGKTVVFSVIAAGANRKQRCTLVVEHRRELIRQACAKLAWAGVPYGVIASGFEPSPDERLQVCSIQTVVRQLGDLPAFDLIIIDEAHHACAETYRALIKSQPKARLLGFTATPARLDGKGLGREHGGPFDALVLGPKTAELITGGFLAPVRCFSPADRPDLSGVRVRAGDYVAEEAAEAVNKPRITGDAIAEYRQRADRQPAIAFCCTVAHAAAVAAAFCGAGYHAAAVSGTTPKVERDALIAGLGDGSIEVLCSCDLISEGLDVPAVGAVLLLRPTKSLVLHRQQIGRGMRPAPDKDALIVLDHVGNVIAHGLPEQEPGWSLDGVPKRPRISVPLVKTCPACSALNRLGVRTCNACGHTWPETPPRELPRVRPGELAELTPDRLAALRGLPYRDAVSGDLSEAELRVYARERGYRRGWVEHVMRAQGRVS
jgi:superfamily II DNA or RNA helicase